MDRWIDRWMDDRWMDGIFETSSDISCVKSASYSRDLVIVFNYPFIMLQIIQIGRGTFPSCP